MQSPSAPRSTACPQMEVGMITSMLERIREESGQTMAEYAVVLAVITVAVVAALITFSGQITSAISAVGSNI